MGAAKKKSGLKKRGQSRPEPRSGAAVAARFQEHSWEQRLELWAGWLVCLIVVAAPLTFHSRITNFADLPQRTVIQAGVALFCALGLARAAVQRRIDVTRSACCCALAAFACWGLLSIFWSTNPYDAFYAAVHWSACALAALGLAAWMHSHGWLGRFAVCVIVSGALVTVLAFLQLFGGMHAIPSVRLPSAAFANPNVLAEFLCMTIVFSVCAAWFVRRRPYVAVACWTCAAAQLVVVYYADCRSAWLALGIAALWSAVLLLKGRTGWKYVVPVILGAVCVLSVAGFSLATKPGFQRQLDGSAYYRLVVWNNTLELIQQKPVAGHGAGSFPYMYGSVLNTYQPDTAFGKEKQIRRAHNDFLQTAAELGLTGAGLLLFFCVGVLITALRLMTPQRSAFDAFIVCAGSGALVVFLVTAFFGFPLQRSVTPFLAFMCAGMVIATDCRERNAWVRFPYQGAAIALVVLSVCAGVGLLRFNLGIIESDGYFKRALAMEKRRNNVKALDFSLRAHAACSGRMDVLTTVGRAYVTTGQLSEGIDALQTVTTRQPYNLNALFILGAGYANAGRSVDALDTFRRVLAIKPDFAEARSIVCRMKSQGRVKVNFR